MTYLGRGNAKAILFALVFAIVDFQAVAAYQYTVGGAYGWTIPINPGYYNKWSYNITFYAGDSLVFKYDLSHDVRVVSYSEYSNCLASTHGPLYTSGMDTIILSTPGDYYFFCTRSYHCSYYGMKMKVTVIAAAPAPAPVAPPPDSGATPPWLAPAASPAVASKPKAGLIAGVCGAVFGVALVGLFLFCFLKRRNYQKPSDQVPHQSISGISGETNSRPYTFKELSSMTKNFNDSELLSSGAFGDVYKGIPPLGTNLLAVKRIKHENKHGQETFLAEVNSLKQIRHRNLLQLRGWCEGKEGMFLVYDFMSNGSLDKWLHPKSNPNQTTIVFEGLSWNARFSILKHDQNILWH